MKQEDNGFPKQSDAMHCVAVQSDALRCLAMHCLAELCIAMNSAAMRCTAQRRPSERAGSEIKARTNLEDEKHQQKPLDKKTKHPRYRKPMRSLAVISTAQHSDAVLSTAQHSLAVRCIA